MFVLSLPQGGLSPCPQTDFTSFQLLSSNQCGSDTSSLSVVALFFNDVFKCSAWKYLKVIT